MNDRARGLIVFNIVLAALVGLFLVACSYAVLNMVALQVVAWAVSQ